jgi:3-dehydroquinate synthase
MPSIPVSLGSKSHTITIGSQVLPQAITDNSILKSEQSRAFVIADEKVKAIAGKIIQHLGPRCAGFYFLTGGESAKDISTLPKLYAAAAQAALDRKSVIIAIGGGAIGDVVGFFAATYLRGVRIMHIPTTLVAQVDSSMGGKTGINLPVGKNLVGAFHQPCSIIIDPQVLLTLPDREFRSGLAEVIKYGVITDTLLFSRLEKKMAQILKRDLDELSWIIERCCRIKAKIVSKDEFETKGLRAILNFGHTIGHGIENAAHYSLLHGEAIALGMIGAVDLSHQLQKLPLPQAKRIKNLIAKAGLPTLMPGHITNDQILAAMRLDKKAAGGQMRFVLAKKIGAVKTGIAVEPEAVTEILEKLRT